MCPNTWIYFQLLKYDIVICCDIFCFAITLFFYMSQLKAHLIFLPCLLCVIIQEKVITGSSYCLNHHFLIIC